MFERTKNLNLSVIKQVEIEAAKYPGIVSLAQGIPSFDTPLCIKRRVQKAIDRGVVAKYSLSPGLPELRELIEISLAKENMFYDWQKEIIVTAGSIQGITATILALTKPGDEVIIPEPTYTSYREVITLAGCKCVFVPLNEDKSWSFEIHKFKKAITPKTKAIFYCNPNNPTGTIYTKKQLLELADLAEKHNLFLISDDVYKDFIYDHNSFFTLASIPELRKRLVRIFSFSKAYAMTGWRVAYLHSDESIVKEILKVHDSLVTCAPVISQYAAMGALEMGDADIEYFKNEYVKRRDIICNHLNDLKNIFEYVRPDSSYFIFPKIKIEKYKSNSWDFVFDLIKNTQIAFVPGVAFGPNGEGHVRISFGRDESDINRAMQKLKIYFNNKL